jgi:transcriptional regulator with XRE-family HTH domain
MVEIGQLLRQTREAKELSLADAEEQTRIRQRYLSALESGDWDDLPNPVAARGFLRTYATFLGLDAEELVDQSQELSEADAPAMPAAAAPPSDYKPINLDLYDDVTRRSHLLRRILGFVIILIPVIILAWLLMQYGLPYLQGRSQGGEGITVTVTLPPEGQAPGDAPVIGPTDTPTGPVVTIEGTLPTFTPTPGADLLPTEELGTGEQPPAGGEGTPEAPSQPAATSQPSGGKLGIGQTVVVTDTGKNKLSFRAGPGTTYEIIRLIKDGTQLTIIGGPKDADGYTWWQMKTNDGLVGWAVEDYLEPVKE